MNIQENRTINDVIVLGCGTSILDLTQEEKNYINQCKTVIAINKYMAFYKMSGLLPTHVYFADTHENSLMFLQHIFSVVRQEKLEGLTFILNSLTIPFSFKSQLTANLFVIKSKIRFAFWKHFLSQERLQDLKKAFYLILPSKCFYQYVIIDSWLEKMPWARNFQSPIFHYRGSLTSILNYCSIEYPNRKIYLVGNDFNGSKYFFEKELVNLPFDSSDWTTALVKKENKHFSFQNYNGTTMVDVFPFILQSLKETGNELFCTNPNSLLVKECKVPYRIWDCGL